MKNNENKTDVVKIGKNKRYGFKLFFKILFVIIFSPVLLLVAIIRAIVKRIKRKKWEKEGLRGKMLLLDKNISDIDIMEGYEFEEYLKTLFFYDGYNASTTSKAKDYGADIILVKDNEKIVVQAKRYSKSVGVKSVQEAVGAIKHYQADSAMVVTNSLFTPAAETIAKENNVRLVDREELIEIYTRVKENLKLSTKESELVDKKDVDIEQRFKFMI